MYTYEHLKMVQILKVSEFIHRNILRSEWHIAMFCCNNEYLVHFGCVEEYNVRSISQILLKNIKIKKHTQHKFDIIFGKWNFATMIRPAHLQHFYQRIMGGTAYNAFSIIYLNPFEINVPLIIINWVIKVINLTKNFFINLNWI